jgi:hypothetical protein
MLAGTEDSVELKRAPLFIREALTFPYRYGLDFEVALLVQAGTAKAFDGTLRNPPTTTRQIMEPNTYLSGEQIGPMPVPDFNSIFRDYDRFDIGAMGEFDVALLVEQYANRATSRTVYPHWRGGYYYAARPKKDPNAPLNLLYASRWSNAEHAAEFAAIYAKSLAKRYKSVSEVAEGESRPLGDLSTFVTLNGRHTWQTEDGPVVIHLEGDTLLVTESFDRQITERLEQEMFPARNDH